ncbi:MAG: glycosyltransferase [Gammaproteobacteria bacterium]
MSTVLMALGVWTALGILWWMLAALVVVRANRMRSASVKRPAGAAGRISIFKPIPSSLGDREFGVVCACLETFVADLDADSELLLGAREPEGESLHAFIEEMRERYPDAHIELLIDSIGATRMHPKVAWNEKLSKIATGDWWLWSDADMRAPTGTLRSLRADVADDAGMVTSPYIVTGSPQPADMLDTLFVNLEFYPGAELLGRAGALRGGFGAGMLFAAEDFRREVDWHELGSHLAEDFVLGTRLAPVRLASTRLSTVPSSSTWSEALLHYLRWQKTIRWCQPAGFASQLIVLPVIGWLAWIASNPGNATAWAGIGFVLLADTSAALVINRLLGCRIGLRQLLIIPCWSILRGLTWAACWLPWPVVWRGKRWWTARLYDPSDTTSPQPEATK